MRRLSQGVRPRKLCGEDKFVVFLARADLVAGAPPCQRRRDQLVHPAPAVEADYPSVGGDNNGSPEAGHPEDPLAGVGGEDHLGVLEDGDSLSGLAGSKP